MSYTDDLSRAVEILKSESSSVAGGQITVYFWNPSDTALALQQIVEFDGAGDSIHERFGLLESEGILSSDSIQSEILQTLDEYVSLGAIDSYEVVDSPINENGQLADLTIGVSSLPEASNGLKSITYVAPNAGAVPDDNSEAVVFFDQSIGNDSDRLREFFALHELGHALGLRHTHHDDASFRGTIYDNQRYSVMSYQGHDSNGTDLSVSN